MPEITIPRMRDLHRQAKELNATIVQDLWSFLDEKVPRFFRLPDSNRAEKDPNPTTTCSCLMALSLTGKLGDMFGRDKATDQVKRAFDVIAKEPWVSSQLPPMNAFTTTIVLRTAGHLHRVGILGAAEYRKAEHHEHSKLANGKYRRRKDPIRLPKIVKGFGRTVPTKFRIWKKSEEPASLTVAYWWLDAVHRRGVGVGLTRIQWEGFCRWPTRQFRKQISLVAADHEAFMDPVALAMAASLCAKLRHLANASRLGLKPYMSGILATRPELRDGLALLMAKQTDAGIWPKYFPLFNYPEKEEKKEKGGGGSNYCFTFEMLEAVLDSFGADDLEFCEMEDVFGGLQKAVNWCRDNKLSYTHEGRAYSGWNSGGQIKTLAEGKPESWATAVVHMFLWELQEVLSRRIQERLLLQHGVAPAKPPRPEAWADLVDIHITLHGGPETVRELFQQDVIDPVEKRKGPMARSALLFGPPGTSKTSVARALAKRLGWPLVTLDPSDFLSKGLDRIYRRANEIFDDLMDLSEAVIFFDEMDALVRSRKPDRPDKPEREDGGDAGPLDMTSQFLTTCMLPKLADLHERARVIFLMATNHRKDFDRAIIRPGRFDLLLCVGPPSWKAKLEGLHLFLRDIERTKAGGDSTKTEEDFLKEAKAARREMKKHVEGLDTKALDLFTYGEFRQFISSLKSNKKSLAKALEGIKENDFRERLKALGQCAWFAPDKHGNNSDFTEYEEDKGKTRRQM